MVDVTGFNGRTWLDQAGNIVDENEHVVERYTMTALDTIVYEARVEDPDDLFAALDAATFAAAPTRWYRID